MIEQGRVGGTCITVGCIPTKTWVQTAHALKEARDTFAKLGVRVGGRARFRDHPAEQGGIVDGLVNGITGVVKANGIRSSRTRPLYGREHDAVEGGEEVRFRRRDRDRLACAAPAGRRHRRAALRRLDRPARGRPGAKRLAVLGGGVIGVEFASILAHWGSEVTIVEMLDHLIPMEDVDASKELARAFKQRRITAPWARGRPVIEEGDHARRAPPVRHGTDGQRRRRPGAGRDRPRAERRRDRARGAGVGWIRARGSGLRPCAPTSRTSTRSATLPDGCSLRTPPSARARLRPRTRSATPPRSTTRRWPRCIYTDPEVAGVGLTEAQAREALR